MPCGGMGILLTDYALQVGSLITALTHYSIISGSCVLRDRQPEIESENRFCNLTWVYQSTHFEVKLEKMKLEYIVIMVNASVVRNKGMDCEPFLV